MYLTETSPSYTRIQRDSLGTMPMAVAGALRGCPRIPRNERFGCDSHARMHPKREMLSVPTQCVTENLLCLGGQCVCMSVSPQVSRIYYHCASATAGDQHLFHETLKDLQSGSQRRFQHFASTARTCGLVFWYSANSGCCFLHSSRCTAMH